MNDEELRQESAWVCLGKVVGDRAKAAKEALKGHLLELHGRDGSASVDLMLGGTKVGSTYLVRRSSGKARYAVADERAFIRWLRESTGGREALASLVGDHAASQRLVAAAVATSRRGRLMPDGVERLPELADVDLGAATRVDAGAFLALVAPNAEAAARMTAAGELPELPEGGRQ